MRQWEFIEGADNIQSYEYSFGQGLARTFAALGPKGWVVVGPACRIDDSVYSALEKRAPVAAIVAPNAFHTMGMRGWHERFPNAKLFAPAQSIARVQKKGQVAQVRPLAEARDLTGDSIELIDMPHYRTGEVLVRASTPAGSVWHVTDVIFNWPSLPPSFFVKLVFNILTDSAPGFKLSGPAALIMMRDKKSVYRWLKEEAQKAPPTRIVPSHGHDIVMNPPGRQLLDLLSTQGKV